MSRLFANRLLQTLNKYLRFQAAWSLVTLLVCCLIALPLQASQQQGLLYQFQKPGGEIHYL